MYAQETAVRRELRGVRRASVLGGRAPGETRQRGVCRGTEKAFAPGTGGFGKAVGGGGPGAACGCGIVWRERILNMETAGWTARGTDDCGNHSLQVTKSH